MTATGRIYRDFNLEENCVHVTEENRVRLYFAQLTLALRGLDRILEGAVGPMSAERQAVDLFLERLIETFRVLGLKYFYATPGEGLRIDASDSGFLHFTTLLELAADAKGRQAEMDAGQPLEALKREMAARIIGSRGPVRDIQQAIARRLYIERLARDKVFDEFVPGTLVHLGVEGGESGELWSFATYDRGVNRPFIYLIFFVYDDDEPLDEESTEFAKLVEGARGQAGALTSLLSMATALDDALEWVSPRIVKRMVLGPYWSPHFTQNEESMDRLFAGHEARSPFVLRWETETLISERQQRIGQGFLSRGQLKQIFWIPKDAERLARGVSHLDRFVLLPYWLAQHASGGDVFAGHQRYVLDSEGDVHGVDERRHDH